MKLRHVEVAAGDLLLLIGTMKGLFLARSRGAKGSWRVGGYYFPRHPVYAIAYDERAGRAGMTLTFHIPGLLRRFTDGKDTIVIEQSARNIREALEVLGR